jgi:hypothetical protein
MLNFVDDKRASRLDLTQKGFDRYIPGGFLGLQQQARAFGWRGRFLCLLRSREAAA